MSRETAMAAAAGMNPAPATPPAAAPPANGAAPAAAPQVPTTPTDPRVQALLKKEADLVRRQELFAKERQGYDERIKNADGILAKGKKFEETLAKDPVEALRLIGFTETQIFNVMAAAQAEPKAKTPDEIAREETQRILKERDEADAKVRSEENAKANEAAIFSGISRVKAVPENAKKYTMLIRNGNMADQIVAETLKEFAKQVDPKDIDQAGAEKLLSEACDAVESWYRDQFKSMVSNDDVVEMLVEMGFTKKQAEAAAAAAGAPAAAAPAPAAKAPTIARAAATATAVQTGAKETYAQKRARLEESLRTGDKSLLRA